jgi:opacity protein-like surface antigen
MYVAGLVGDSIPYTLSDVEGVGTNTGLSSWDLQLRYSKMYGVRIGYYFDSMKWLGVETEYFHSAPHVMRQPTTAYDAGGAITTKILPGQDIRLNTWAPINVVVRHQMGKFEPYAGVGMGIFFAHLRDGATHETSDSTTLGLNTQVGLRYFVTKNISLIGDFKYVRASFNFEESSPTQAAGGFKGEYSAHILSVGFGYHF